MLRSSGYCCHYYRNLYLLWNNCLVDLRDCLYRHYLRKVRCLLYDHNSTCCCGRGCCGSNLTRRSGYGCTSGDDGSNKGHTIPNHSGNHNRTIRSYNKLDGNNSLATTSCIPCKCLNPKKMDSNHTSIGWCNKDHSIPSRYRCWCGSGEFWKCNNSRSNRRYHNRCCSW